MSEYWKCDIPDGEIGEARLQSFEVSESDARWANMRGAMITAGKYKRLYVDRELMMSDTPKERYDHSSFINKAKGNVLINGLGMGCCLKEVINKPEVASVTVIEKSADVIALIGEHFPEAEIICADAFDWTPPKGVVYGSIWHDIWPDICTDNLPEMHKLHRKYGKKSEWQGSWSRDELENSRRRY